MKYYTFAFLVFSLLIASQSASFGQVGYKEKGKASYYADKFNGRKTASGEIFSNNKMTAAHRTLKFNTMVKVTNLTNNKSVIVRINDRGPYAHNRIIDLSKVAAQEVDMIRTGTAKVQIEVIGVDGQIDNNDNTDVVDNSDNTDTPNTNDSNDAFFTGKSYSMWGTQKFPKGYGVQVGSYEDLENAKDLCKSLIKQNIEEVYIQVGWSGRRVYRVLVGAFEDKSQGDDYVKLVQKAGFDGFVKKHFD